MRTEDEAARDEHNALVDAAMEELELCGCDAPQAVLALLIGALEELTVPHLERTKRDVHGWARQAFRPCCGTCRAPFLGEAMPDRTCLTCGVAWDGSEASSPEAFYRSTLVPSTAGRMLGLYYLDKLELTEHGGSVGGGWLTQKGLEFLMRYRRLVETSC